jgi:hypothetical protein
MVSMNTCEAPMKLSTYIVRFDTGFAPNPFGRFCTLACCKPTIRRNAKRGDIIVGTASSRLPKRGRVIYAMRVGEVLPYDEYWRDSRFACRKPSGRTRVSRCGDNIWHRDAEGQWRTAPSGYHDQRHQKRDTSGRNVLVATEYYYFGRKAIRVPERFSGLLAKTQGHKNERDADKINGFWQWIVSKAPKQGRIAYPFEFTNEACRNQYGELEEDDFEET